MLTTTTAVTVTLLIPWSNTASTQQHFPRPVFESESQSSCNKISQIRAIVVSPFSPPCPRVRQTTISKRRNTIRSENEVIVPPPLLPLLLPWPEDTDSSEPFWWRTYRLGQSHLLLWRCITTIIMLLSLTLQKQLCLLLVLGYPPKRRNSLCLLENSLLHSGKSMICLLQGSRRNQWEATRRLSETELRAYVDQGYWGHHICQIHLIVLSQR